MSQEADETKILFHWTDDLSVSIPEIDAQHKVMIGYINDAYKAMQDRSSGDEIKKILKNLLDYSRVHFADEEKLLMESSYPETKEHQIEHLEYCNRILDFYAQFVSGESNLAVKIAPYLRGWLYNHIMVSDKKYARFLIIKRS